MKFQSQFTINYKEDKLMTPEAERFNGWTLSARISRFRMREEIPRLF